MDRHTRDDEDDFHKKLEEAVRAILERKVEELFVSILKHEPIDTGRMLASTTMKKTGDLEWTITVATPYASFVEEGTRYIQVGTPEHPRTTWKAKEKRKKKGVWLDRESTMPYLSTALYEWDKSWG